MLFSVTEEPLPLEGQTTEELIRQVYPQLRETARWLLRSERVGHTLQPTALVHETFLRMLGKVPAAARTPKAFLALAAHQMRQILIDYGRRRNSQKRGGDWLRVPMLDADTDPPRDTDSFTDLNEALERLGGVDPRALAVVESKFFAGFTNHETAEILGLTEATVEATWHHARLWLLRELKAASPLRLRIAKFNGSR
jgi:RNA polymerase sigma-70 factor (ECF subfamily)